MTEPVQRLDQIDLKILEVLQSDASLENQEVARRVSLSAAACLRRVRRLRDGGVISAIVAIVDSVRVGLHVQAYAFISLESQRPSSGNQLENMVKRRPEVLECVRLSGKEDLMLKIAVESIEAYTAFLDAHVLSLPAVRSVNTSFELGVLKRSTALPVAPTRQKRWRGHQTSST